MKILHTGDWHIGKLVHQHHMTQDQRHILKALVDLIEKEKIDLLIIAGDVYDRSIPPTQAVDLLDEILSEIIGKLKVPVIAIAGNHDSADRLSFGSKILRDQGLYIRGPLTETIEPVILEDEYGKVNFYPIPFAEPAVVRYIFNDDTCKNHDLAMKKVIDTIQLDQHARNVAIAHGFVMGTEDLETSDSERPLSIGGSEFINVNYFDDFDYVALGHLHRPQKVKRDTVRYAGSLLKYSFSEAKQKKSVTIIDLGPKGDITVEQVHLMPIRDMRVIKGDLAELISEDVYSLGNQEDYISAIVTDKGMLYEPVKKLRSVYPNLLQMEREQLRREAVDEGHLSSEDVKHKSPSELFEDFCDFIGDASMDEEASKIFAKAYQEAIDDERSR